MPRTDMPRLDSRVTVLIFLIGVFIIVALLFAGTPPRTSNLPAPTIIKIIKLSEHPYYGYPPHGDYVPPYEEAWDTHLLRVWSDGACETAVMHYWPDGSWSMSAWTHPEQE